MEHELFNFDSYNVDPFSLFSIQDMFTSNDFENDIENVLQLDSDRTYFDRSVHPDGVSVLENVQENITFQYEEILDNLENSEEIQDGSMESCDLIDLLLKGAEAVEAENWLLAPKIVTKLNNLLSDQENGDNPLVRLALYFTEGLIYKSLSSLELLENSILPQPDSFPAFQMLQELSPYMKFAHFTANQAILEAIRYHQELHVVDFDVMEGAQWPPLMSDLSSRHEYADVSLRITAVVTDEKKIDHVRRTGLRLQEFANSINLNFMFDRFFMRREQDFEDLEVSSDSLVANVMLHQLHMPHKDMSLVKVFLNGIQQHLSPKIVILVENELYNLHRVPSMSFVEYFKEALQHYGSISDSLITGFGRGYKSAVKIVEKEFMRMRILESLKEFPSLRREMGNWGNEWPCSKGFRPIPMSSCNVTQAKFLVSLFKGGYWVQNEKRRLTLCWKSRPLITASVWAPKTRK
ncbi:protein NODULATION SIGNALING PATHWAY 2-like [Henckelia pumila]|uniref:protein NODULATION SIGNALING PATHWAY 2-like n=1 Tax=Henckelia pumila TaxID=405737 RepID=UPI003C6DE878